MLLQALFMFSIAVFLFILLGKFDNFKLKITNIFFIVYFLGNIGLGLLGFQNDINVNFLNYNLFHIGIIESFSLMLFGAVGIGVSLYSNYYFTEYLHHKKELYFYYIMIALFMFAMQSIIICSNAIYFLVMWEIMTLSSYFLVIHEYTKKGSFEGGNYYLIIAHIGMFFILFSFIPFIISSGSFDFMDWHGSEIKDSMKNFAFFSALIGFGAKAGIWPLDIWLPKAHPIAPSNISSIMSGFMVKLPIMMLLKFIIVFFALQVHLSWGLVLITIGSLSAFLGIFYALTQNDIKKILAFSTIENVGFIVVGLGIFVLGLSLQNTLVTTLGLTALFYHIANHSMYKTLMFMVAGSIIERTGTKNISELGGLIKVLPFLGVIALLGCLTIAGIPPFASFNSEIMGMMGIIQIIVDSNNHFVQFIAIASIILIALMSVFAFITFSKFYATIFVGRQRNKNLEINSKPNIYESISYVYFLIFIFGLSISPGIFTNLSQHIMYGDSIYFTKSFLLQIGNFSFTPYYLIIFYIGCFILGFVIYRSYLGKARKLEPWNCGYSYIPDRSQYSSGSLIQPIRRVYDTMYMQASHIEYNDYYKKNRNIHTFLNTKAYFTDILYTTTITIIKYIGMRIQFLQNGILQYYIGYVFATLLCMLTILYFSL